MKKYLLLSLLLIIQLSGQAMAQSADVATNQPHNDEKTNTASKPTDADNNRPVIPELREYQPRVRTGIDPTKKMRISLQDAIAMMLEHNIDVQMEKNNIKSKESSLFSAQGVYDFALGGQFGYLHLRTPTISALEGDPRASFTESYTYKVDLSRELTNGASFKTEFSTTHLETNNRFLVYNPIYVPDFSFTYRQPLLRNYRVNQNQRIIRSLKEQLGIADLNFRKRLIELIAHTQAAYYDLAYAIENEKIQRDAVKLAAEQIRRDQVKVESGGVAPIDVTSAEAEFERRKEIAINELYSITQAENNLKNLLIDDPTSDAWNYEIVPIDPIQFVPDPMSLNNAIEIAMTQRPEIKELELQGKINQIDIEYMKNQLKPQVDITATFSSRGLGGDTDTANFFNVKQQADTIGGYGTALKNLFKYRTYQVGVTFTMPFGNRTAKANLTNALIAANQIDSQKRKLLQSITTEVRNALQNLDVAAQRIEATHSSVIAATKQLEAEQVRFQVGLSTNYFVLERQNSLSTARSHELRAITDYIKAHAELQRVMGNNIP